MCGESICRAVVAAAAEWACLGRATSRRTREAKRLPADADLDWWAERAREWQGAGKDVFVYFNNDGDGNAVRNAAALRIRIA